jgi:hypothetical protein
MENMDATPCITPSLISDIISFFAVVLVVVVERRHNNSSVSFQMS